MSHPDLEREIRRQAAHIAAQADALAEANRQNVQLRAQVKEVAEAGARRLGEASNYIDALHNRIEAMVDEWQAQLRSHDGLTNDERDERLASVEAFRPVRVAAAVVAPAGAASTP